MSASSNESKTLQQLAREGHVEKLRESLLAGGDPNQRDNEGNTPLHIAARYNKKEIAEELLKFGANADIKNNNGQKPANSAIYFNPGSISINPIVKLLESMSTAISTLFGGRKAAKQANFMFDNNNENMERIVTFQHTSSDLLKAIVVREAERGSAQDLIKYLTLITNSHRDSNFDSKLNFLRDSSVISKICANLQKVENPRQKEAIINKLQEMNTKQRTVNYEMLEKAKAAGNKAELSSSFSSLWHGTVAATKKEVKRVKDVIDNARKPGPK